MCTHPRHPERTPLLAPTAWDVLSSSPRGQAAHLLPSEPPQAPQLSPGHGAGSCRVASGTCKGHAAAPGGEATDCDERGPHRAPGCSYEPHRQGCKARQGTDCGPGPLGRSPRGRQADRPAAGPVPPAEGHSAGGTVGSDARAWRRSPRKTSLTWLCRGPPSRFCTTALAIRVRWPMFPRLMPPAALGEGVSGRRGPARPSVGRHLPQGSSPRSSLSSTYTAPAPPTPNFAQPEAWHTSVGSGPRELLQGVPGPGETEG